MTPVSTQAPEIPVSFLVTSYNKAAYLPAVLDSVWRESQAVGGEVVLVDDGSSDGSEGICAAFAQSHREVVYWRQENQGIFPTVNGIAAKVRGKWVRFCDSDDPLIAGSTRRLIDIATETGAGVAYGRAIVYGPAPLTAEQLSLRIKQPAATNVHPDGVMYLIRGMNFTPSMSICRADALKDALPLPVDLVSCQDLALWFPIVSRLPLAWINEPVCFNLKGVANQLTANDALTLQQTIRITQRNAGLLTASHKRAAVLKAANRTRRWLRRMRPDRNSLGAQFWLLGVNARARLGLIDFNTTLDKIADYYEYELEAILKRRARPF
ncbi:MULTISPECIES: glycosyltransferase family 2 protein [Rhodomicrobium]|uniref:glycosyltransferase family 2 protein n=1 Tax=Rhodomicrobium TaxID=1068 RepID=UPI000B4BEC0D|nr:MULTISPECIES: glycosyltransferase family 2 protein [Rhodomicrobium]